jgi:hypothetical protein
MNYKTFRRRALQIAIGFLVLTALVAIVSVFMDDFGHLYAKILATCFTISVACLCTISSTAFIEQRRQVSIGSVGILLSLVAAGLIIIDRTVGTTEPDFYLLSNQNQSPQPIDRRGLDPGRPANRPDTHLHENAKRGDLASSPAPINPGRRRSLPGCQWTGIPAPGKGSR